MIVLAIDTCDSRGSVAVLQDDVLLGSAAHETAEDYSSWLLLAVDSVMKKAGLGMGELDGCAVASGPGSFTGVRIGLTTVKAWAEVYGKAIAAVSRLEAFALQAREGGSTVAAFIDAQRGQVFGAIYRREDQELERIGEEAVITPGRFVEWAVETAKGERISWVSPDPAHVLVEAAWKERQQGGESIEPVSARLATVIGRMGARRLAQGRSIDAVALDANYVRRSDAEIFWKGGASHGH